MPLTEAEELELLELERERAKGGPDPIESQKQAFGYMENLGKFYTEDIPSTAKGVASRTMERAKRIEAPTELGTFAQKATGTTGKLGEFVEGVAGAPERLVRTVGGALGTLGEIPAAGIELAVKSANRFTGGVLGDMVKPVAEKVAKKIVESDLYDTASNWWNGLDEANKANLSTIPDLMEAFDYGAGKVTGKVAGKVGGATGEGVEKLGKTILKGDMKIEKPLAKKLGPTLDKAKNRIADVIAENDLESVVGNFDKMAKRADDIYESSWKKADAAIESYVKNNPEATVDVGDLFARLEGEVANAVKLGKEDQATKTLQNILDSAIKRVGVGDGPVSLNKLVEIKRKLNPDNSLFSKGVQNIAEDPIERQVYEKVYLDIIKEIEKAVPEAAQLNRKARDLRFVRDAAEAASSRTSNNQFMGGLGDRIATAGGLLGAASNPDEALKILTLSGLYMVGNRAIGQGRGASAIIEAGKAAKGASKALPTLGAPTGAALGSFSARPLNEDKTDSSQLYFR